MLTWYIFANFTYSTSSSGKLISNISQLDKNHCSKIFTFHFCIPKNFNSIIQFGFINKSWNFFWKLYPINLTIPIKKYPYTYNNIKIRQILKFSSMKQQEQTETISVLFLLLQKDFHYSLFIIQRETERNEVNDVPRGAEIGGVASWADLASRGKIVSQS